MAKATAVTQGSAVMLALTKAEVATVYAIIGMTDINGLNAKSGSVIDRLFNIAQTLSGLSDDDVDELAGNSAAVPSGGSGSNSPVPSG